VRRLCICEKSAAGWCPGTLDALSARVIAPWRDDGTPSSRANSTLAAALLLSIALAFDDALRFLVALPMVVLALVIATHGLRAGRTTRSHVQPSIWMLLAAMSALGTVGAATGGPLWYELTRRSFAAAGVVLVGLVSGRNAAWRRTGLMAAIAGSVLLQLLTPAAIQSPQIDVVAWTNTAIDALRHGIHPYTVQAPDVYRGGRDFGFVVSVYPYMPASMLVLTPLSAVLHDYRYGLALCLPVSLWLIRRLGATARVPRRAVDAATLAVALNPAGPLMVRSGWSEPLLVLLACLAAYGITRRRGAMTTASVLLMPAFKQYALAPVVLWAAHEQRDWRRTWRWWLAGAAAVLATVAPFAAWNWRATLDGIVFQMAAPARPRLTAISIPGLLAATGHSFPPVWVSAVLQLVVCGVLARSGVMLDAAGVLIGSAVAFLVTFLLGWQAFPNYFAFVAALLVVGSMVAAARTGVL
jgi:hypothetical protein